MFFSLSFQADSEEEEEVFNSSKESVELYCVHAHEKLTSSIRLQWRRLKSHVERLDSQGPGYSWGFRTLSNKEISCLKNCVSLMWQKTYFLFISIYYRCM